MGDTKKVIDGTKLVYQTGQRDRSAVNKKEYPFTLTVNCCPPEFMEVMWALSYGGSEEVIVAGKTTEALDEFVKLNNFETHPRLRWFKITDAKGKVLRER